MFKNNLRLLIEFIVIISGVLLSFYIDDFRQLQNKKLEKDILIGELVITAREDLKQIQNLKKDLIKVQDNIKIFLKDIQDNRKDIADKEIAINYLFISEKMSVSFFPQDGIFSQLISTGSLELIESSTLKNLLLRNFTHYLDRNQANNRTLDDLYLDFVNKTIKQENKIEKGKEDLSIAVAKYLYKLMAYKDEYEVARLYTNGEFKEKLHKAFEGDLKLKFHVAPPLFSPKDPNTGKLKKITLGSWILPVFKILSKFKFLRGTLLDPFGKTKERKMERFLINQYINDINKILNELNTKNISLAVQIASIPEMIRGYGHVKEENMIKAEIKRKELLEIWNSKEDSPVSAIAAE